MLDTILQTARSQNSHTAALAAKVLVLLAFDTVDNNLMDSIVYLLYSTSSDVILCILSGLSNRVQFTKDLYARLVELLGHSNSDIVYNSLKLIASNLSHKTSIEPDMELVNFYIELGMVPLLKELVTKPQTQKLACWMVGLFVQIPGISFSVIESGIIRNILKIGLQDNIESNVAEESKIATQVLSNFCQCLSLLLL
jgi:hypothetical protein